MLVSIRSLFVTFVIVLLLNLVIAYPWMAKKLQAKRNLQGQSLCDKYTTIVFTDNTPANQLLLLTLVVNTAVIGNYTPGALVKVNGILNKGEYGGEEINLLPYFIGVWNTTNVNGEPGMVNFLDGGGAAPLLQNMPADDTTSNQYFLLTHLYQLFGQLLGCSMQGNSVYPSYQGDAALYDTHQFMNLSANQMGYFITQVGLSATSFGVTQDDVNTVATALIDTFDYKCLPPEAGITYAGAHRQSICIGAGCPLASNPDCSDYTNHVAGADDDSSTGSSSGGGAHKLSLGAVIAIYVCVGSTVVGGAIAFLAYIYYKGGKSFTGPTPVSVNNT